MNNHINKNNFETESDAETSTSYYDKLKALLEDEEHFNEPVSEKTLKGLIESLNKLSLLIFCMPASTDQVTDTQWVDTYHARKIVPVSKGKFQKLRESGKLETHLLGGKLYFKKENLNKLFELHEGVAKKTGSKKGKI